MELKNLKVGVQTGGIFDACTKDEAVLDEGFKLIKDTGFDCVDYNIDNFLPSTAIRTGELTDFFDKSVEEICECLAPTKAAAERHGIAFSQMHAPFPLHVAGKDSVNTYMMMVAEKTLAAAAYLGCPAVVMHPFTHPCKEYQKEVNLGMYRAMMPAAKKYGVKVCLENLFENSRKVPREGACAMAEEACWYVDTLNAEAGEEIFGFCFDVGHANLLRKNIREYLRAIGHRLTILHIHDNDGMFDSHMVPYTQNIGFEKFYATDWESFIDGLKIAGYRGVLSFETFRAVENAPKPIVPSILQNISAIGRYFSDRVLEK